MTKTPLTGEQVAELTIRQLMPFVSVERLLSLFRQAIEERNAAGAAIWEFATMAGELAKPLIEARSGASLSIEEVAELLSVSKTDVQAMLQHDELIAYPSLDGHHSRFPVWQFTAAISPAKVHIWVAPLLAAYGPNGWGLIDFLTVPRITDNGLNYLNKILGEPKSVSEIIAAARRCNPD